MNRTLTLSLTLAALLAVGCEEEGEETAPILDENHAGWRAQDCAGCHKLPEEDHTSTDPRECAACHGGNGACAPNGDNSKKKDHEQASACASCHGPKHQLSACANCHFASAGVIPCGVKKKDAGPTLPDLALVTEAGSGPTLSSKLTPNCLQGWPATPFSPANKTGWVTALSAGQRAVAFTLKDTAGKAYALADLLKKGPVWLQLGSYT